MVEDHVAIDDSLRAVDRNGDVDARAFETFRGDLLRHIAMEEKVLLPYARSKRGGVPLPLAGPLRADHGQLAKLLVSAPTHEGLANLRALLDRHNPLEEGADGLYAACDRLAGMETLSVLERLRAQPYPPLAKYHEGPLHPPR
jgi:hypothetical protein